VTYVTAQQHSHSTEELVWTEEGLTGSFVDGPDTLEKRLTLNFKGDVAFVKMPRPSVPKLFMSDRRFNWSLRHGRFYCTLLLSVFSDEKIRFSNFAALS
jgi:hypothetical protein